MLGFLLFPKLPLILPLVEKNRPFFAPLTVHPRSLPPPLERCVGDCTVGAGDDLGTLEVGKLADIVLLDANPLEDIKNTQTIWRVIKGGFVFDPEELRPERN